ncbi:amidase family protein [Solwaraspora sp. WMMD791]|uniref:amidase family protein n=1 Tax=Solwaraspora sp. WMMD791 TaxID=3016086 RepID=UPI00249BA9C6|nr:amidase family protein [Solwaraspora sp. WMMD791]WFE28744.1 amidase family protein [Solwaraspora sp. WMMD791]
MSESGDAGPDPCWWSARQVADAIAARRISAREYLDAQLARIEEHNARLGLVVTIDERARERARQADEATVRGERWGPLHGVAMTIKDCFATAGLRTTGGLTQLRTYQPREDATAVAALRAAGVVVFGKTNVPSGSGDLQSYNELFGVACNPWNQEYTTSGSSGGAAGAVAAGFTPIELGSDVAGSIRVPAGACGVLGHKTSYRAVPMIGHVPPYPFKPREADIAVVGPIARTVDDLETVLTAIAVAHPLDAPAWHLTLPPPRSVRRVATWFDDPYCPVDAEVLAALRDAADRLADSGVVVEEARPSGVRLAGSDGVFRRLLASVAMPEHTAEEIGEIAAGRRPPNAVLGGEHVAQSYRDWVEADEQRNRLRLRWRQFFASYDAILLPVAPNLATRHDHRPLRDRTVTVDGVPRPYWDQIVWAGLTGVSYLPSTVLPVRRDSRGLPIGVAVAGDYLQDRTTLAVARRLAEVLPPIGHPDLTAVAADDLPVRQI